MKKGLIIGSTTVLLLAGLGYSAGVGFYAQKFQANTKFGSLDISNLTLAEAEDKIGKDLNQKEVTILENGKEVGRFTLEQAGVQVDANKALESAYNSQDPTGWVGSFFNTTEYKNVLLNHVAFNDENLSKTLDGFGLNNQNRTAAEDAKIEYSNGQGYHVTPEKAGNQLDVAKVKELIVSQVQSGNTSVEINSAYQEPKIKSDDPKITQVMDQINKVADTKITLTISGKEEVVPKDKINDWIQFDESNNLVVDQSKVQDYVKELNTKYATINKTRKFASTLSGVVDVQPGTLGWSIDSEAEAEKIVADLNKGGTIKREPTVVGTGYADKENDIGPSYVEVDIAHQMMFIYKDGKKVLETPVVTGRPGTTTIPGAYASWNKESPSTLKGYNPHTQKEYQQPVDYWIPFDDTGQGIHDANWQASFGGEAYLSNGSLGCINTPPGTMAEVYQLVEVGMPVIIF